MGPLHIALIPYIRTIVIALLDLQNNLELARRKQSRYNTHCSTNCFKDLESYYIASYNLKRGLQHVCLIINYVPFIPCNYKLPQ